MSHLIFLFIDKMVQNVLFRLILDFFPTTKVLFVEEIVEVVIGPQNCDLKELGTSNTLTTSVPLWP